MDFTKLGLGLRLGDALFERIIAREQGTIAVENLGHKICKHLKGQAKRVFLFIERSKQDQNKLDVGKWSEQQTG